MERIRSRFGAGDRWRVALICGVIAAVALASCASAGSTATRAEPTTTSSPFLARTVPDGFHLVVAGKGTQYQAWGDDCCGTNEPFTVLSPDGGATGPEVVVVSATGFAGYEGQLDQASAGYTTPGLERLMVDGHDAVFASAVTTGDRQHGADLVVDRGNDVAIRVTKAKATVAELEAIERRVLPPKNHLEAPRVPDPPDGLQVVGHVDADVVMSTDSGAMANLGAALVPGSSRSHTVGWTKGRSSLLVETMPGTSGDVSAFAAFADFGSAGRYGTTRTVTVDGRPGVLYSERNLADEDGSSGTAPKKYEPRTLLTTTPWGDLVAVSTQRGCCGSKLAAPLTETDLVDTAASVVAASDAQWKALRVRAFGGPGLNPDSGREEVARGTSNDVGWLLQTGSTASPVPVDPCLKLSTLNRVCATGGFNSGNGISTWTDYSPDAGSPDLHGLQPFVIVTTNQEGDALWVKTSKGTQRGELHELPGGKYRTAIVFYDGKVLGVDVH